MRSRKSQKADCLRRAVFDCAKSKFVKIGTKKETSPQICIPDQKIKKFVEKLPFALTNDQKKAAWQIIKDLQGKTPMNCLLNGDVGSGKTIVVAIAAYTAVEAVTALL